MKKLLVAILIVVALVIVAAVVVPFFIPVDAFKAKLIAEVKQTTGRDLRIDGPVSFHLLPNIELSADQVSFSNAPGGIAKNMAQLKSLEVRLQLLPLLSGTVVVDAFVLVDPVIALEVEKDGRPNWEFGTSTTPPTRAPAAIAPAPATAGGGPMSTLARLRLANLQIENGTVSYVDTRTGKRWEAAAINMKIAMAGLDSPMSASGSVAWNKQTVNLDLAVSRPAAFEGGEATPIKLKIASAPINFNFTGTGVGAPTLKLNGDADLNIPSVRGLAAWAGQPMPAGNGFGLLAIKGKVAIAGPKYAFGNAVIAFDAIKGNGGIEFDNGGAKPYIKGSLQLDDLNLNPYIGGATGSAAAPAPASPVASGGGAPANAEQGWSTTPIDTSGLKVADADFFLGANSIEYHNIKIGKSALILRLKDARLTADLTQLALYKGAGQGKVTIDGSGAVPAIQESFALKGVDVQPLLHDAANVNLLSGNGSLDMTIDGRGRSQRDIISSLSGRGSLNLDKGKIEGVNIIGMMKNAAKALSMGLVGSGNDTDFSTLSGTYTITNGILKNNDLKLVSPELPMTGAGTIDLPQRQVNYRLTPKVAGALAVPVEITGPWDHLSYRPDVGAILQQSGQQLLQQPGKTLQQVVPKQFQNLFGK
ncbi:MAG TPA: AsmA family protein [Stellaceae bacterium]|nr:AsmA family protein [Stellaceae bacterium]